MGEGPRVGGRSWRLTNGSGAYIGMTVDWRGIGSRRGWVRKEDAREASDL
jgi:hypothetical protein